MLYIALAILLVNVRLPQSDEGHFAEGAAEIVTSGTLVTPTWTEWFPTLNQHLYAAMPLYFVALAGWFRGFGVGMLSMRYFNVCWGAILVVAYFVFVRSITKNKCIALLALLLMAVNYDLINLTTARYDGMAAALSGSGLASYGVLREDHLWLAILSANTFIAAAAMTHPYGAFGVGSLLVLFLILDRRRFKPKYLVLAAVPYMIALSAWGVYVSQDMVTFKAQFLGNANAHKTSLRHPLSLVYDELHERYWVHLAGMRAGVPIYARLKLGLLALYLVSLIGSMLTPQIRKDTGVSAVLACLAVVFFALMLGDGSHLYNYLVHIISLYSIVLAIWLTHLSRSGRLKRTLVVLIVCGVGVFTVASIAYRVRLNPYGNAYLPAAAYLQNHVVDGQLVFAGGEFVFPLGFDRHLLDDPRLGYGNHKHADYIVVGNAYASKFQQQKIQHPEIYEYLMRTLRTYTLEFESRAGPDFYRVYARSDLVRQPDVTGSREQLFDLKF